MAQKMNKRFSGGNFMKKGLTLTIVSLLLISVSYSKNSDAIKFQLPKVQPLKILKAMNPLKLKRGEGPSFVQKKRNVVSRFSGVKRILKDYRVRSWSLFVGGMGATATGVGLALSGHLTEGAALMGTGTVSM